MPHPEIQELLDNLPQVRTLSLAAYPQELPQQVRGVKPDVVLVEMNGHNQVPDWLQELILSQPQAAVLLCAHAQNPEFLIRAMQVGVREFLPLPLTRPALEAALQRIMLTRKRLHPADENRGRIIVVTGHKGGAGATTVAAHLALAMATGSQDKIALVDLGRPFPDVGNFLDQEASYSISDLIQNLESLDQSFVERLFQSYNDRLDVLHGIAYIRDLEDLHPDALAAIFNLLRNLYRYIVVDLSHWLDHIFFHVINEADLVLLVSALTVPDLRNLKKFWPMLLEWHQDRSRVKLLINRFDKGGEVQVSDLDHVIQQTPYYTLPLDSSAAAAAVNQGSPLNQSAPRSKLWRGFQELAAQVRQTLPLNGAADEIKAASKKRFWLF